jgi:hypothetical protein
MKRSAFPEVVAMSADAHRPSSLPLGTEALR